MADASAVLSALLNDGPARHELREAELNASALVDAEVTHALRRRSRAGQIDADQGRAVLLVLQASALARHPIHPLLGRMWDLRDNLSAYDAAYVALAEALDCTLVTADSRIARAPGIACAITVVPS